MERMEDEAFEERAAWIREQLGDEEADEDTEGWDRLSEEYDLLHPGMHSIYDDDWEVQGKSHFEIFSENVEASLQILKSPVPVVAKKNLLVMLHAHVVTAIEAYLSATFIEAALRTEDFMRRLVETDPEFARRKFTIQEIFTKRDTLKDDLRQYLKSLIFHDIAKVEKMYKSVLDIDFGEVDWLFKAVALRHDCVHRAGYDKDGSEVPLSEESISELAGRCTDLGNRVEKLIVQAPRGQDPFWKF